MRALRVCLVIAAVWSIVPTPARAEAPACSARFEHTVAGVGEHRCVSTTLGGETPFSYYVPAGCTDASPCPVVYLLHGFSGDYRSMLGSAESPSAWTRALWSDPATGAARDPLSLILVAPHGRTVAPAGPGRPSPGLESFWVDWNPRYWTEPPRFEAFVTEELRALVEESLPAIRARGGRAIDGVSLGGFGAFKLALQHPDLYENAGSVSGALNILVAPGVQPMDLDERPLVGVPIEPVPYARAPRVITTPPFFPFGDPFGAFGDPVADEAYFRGNNPLDLAVNARGLNLRFFHNDTIARDPVRDASSLASLAGAFGLEAAVLPMNLEMRAALTQHGLSFEHEIHPGLHSGPYWDPYVRAQLEWHASRLIGPDGVETGAAPPARFDFRSVRRSFSVWDWHVEMSEIEPVEMVSLFGVSRDGFRIVGSGRARIVTPPLFATGVTVEVELGRGSLYSFGSSEDGRTELIVDLGPPGPTDEHAGASGVPGARHELRVRLRS